MNHAIGTSVLTMFFVFGSDGRGADEIAAHERSAKVPATLMIKGGSPFFISLASVTTPSGVVDWSAVPEITRTILQTRVAEKQHQRAQSDGSVAKVMHDEPCSVRTITPHQVDSRSWSQLTSSAPAAYRGRIVATSPGLFPHSSWPATLLAVEITQVIRAAPGYPVSGIVYVQTSAIDVLFGGERFCNVGQHDGFQPEVGDAVLLFPGREPIDDAGVVLPIADERMIFSRRGAIRLPLSLAGDATLPKTVSLDTLTSDAAKVPREH